MCTKIPDTAREVLARCQNSGELVHKVEKEVMRFDHADIGEVLLKEWKLPLSLVEMIASHHNPLRSKHFTAETAVIHGADIIAHALQIGNSGEILVPPLNAQAWEQIGIAPGMLSSALDETERQFAAAIQLMYQQEQRK
jgi:HD-like signal output (HDOD) protein